MICGGSVVTRRQFVLHRVGTLLPRVLLCASASVASVCPINKIKVFDSGRAASGSAPCNLSFGRCLV
jgi:hypothetical protein